MLVSGSTRLAGVIGDPVRHSLSPVLHNAAYRELGIDVTYVAMPVAAGATGAAIAGLRAIDALGISVTLPHKEAVIEHLDGISDAAHRLNAVNCIHFGKDGAQGYNTDGQGFVASLLDAGFDPQRKSCVVVGAGGAARAVIEALGSAGASRVGVLARDRTKAEQAAKLAGEAGAEVSDIAGADLYVNATPVGMAGEREGALPPGAEQITGSMLVADLVYNPLRTRLLGEAAARGALTVEGTGMLLHQAAEQIRIWTGAEAPVEVMRSAMVEALR